MGKEKSKEKAVAKDLYVNKLWTAKDVCEFVDVSENTLTKWKSTDPEGDWDKQREKVITNPLVLKQLVLDDMVSIAQGNQPKIDADSMAKLNKVVEGLNDKIQPGIVAAILKLQDEFLVKENPQLALQLLPYNKKFIVFIINTYG
jgi:uncharacterized protein YjcR